MRRRLAFGALALMTVLSLALTGCNGGGGDSSQNGKNDNADNQKIRKDGK